MSKKDYSDKELDPIILEEDETNSENYLHLKKVMESKQRQSNVMITKYNPNFKGEKKHS